MIPETPSVSTVEVLPPEHAIESRVVLPARMTKKLSSSPIALEATWDSARRWLDHSKRLQEAALFCQMMVGLELIALQASTPKTAHRPKRGETPANAAGVSFTSLAIKETGLSERTVRTFMRMAEAALPRLRKNPALKGFDPRTQSINLLPPAQQSALSTAVRKITDGLTQSDFLIELGLAKAPQGSAVKGGARDRKAAPSPQEQAAAEAGLATTALKGALMHLRGMHSRFTLMPDEEFEGYLIELEGRVQAYRRWLETPKNRRDIEALEQQILSL